MLISVIIPTYNREVSLIRTIKNILKGKIPENDYEIIVCDDGSTDNTKILIKDLMKVHSSIKYIQLTHTGNPAKVRNAGLKKAKGTIIAFTDNDTLPNEEWLMNGIKHFTNKDIAGVEGYICTDKLLIRNWYAPVKDRRSEKDNPHSWYGYFLANMFYKKEILEKIGGFDESFITNEDIDIAWRVLSFGKIIFDEDVSVFHYPVKKERKEFLSFLKDRRIYDALLFKKHSDNFVRMFKRTFNYQRKILGAVNYIFCLVKGAFIFKVLPPFYKLLPFLFKYYLNELIFSFIRIKNRIKRKYS
ncbi:MAG: glycosyltransferase [Candidatus Aureabacteria bacterium]|nr:glycosyltransferase [Candidatus Auribacterota bacterium]